MTSEFLSICLATPLCTNTPLATPVALPDYLFTFLWGVLKTAQTVNVRPFNFFVKCKAQTEREIRLLVCGRDERGWGLNWY